MTSSTLRTLTVVFGVLALLGGCSTPTNYVVVPDEEPSVTPAQPPEPRSPERYTVKPGDSLYLISFATGTDWREIARLNGINAPYKIFPGSLCWFGKVCRWPRNGPVRRPAGPWPGQRRLRPRLPRNPFPCRCPRPVWPAQRRVRQQRRQCAARPPWTVRPAQRPHRAPEPSHSLQRRWLLLSCPHRRSGLLPRLLPRSVRPDLVPGSGRPRAS